MKSFLSRPVLSRVCLVATLAGSLLLGGCIVASPPKYKVLVDAITLPGTPKPGGLSYRLVARPSVVNSVQAQVAVVKACVDAALQSQGMIEAAPTAAPDLFIEVSYGREAMVRVDPSLQETHLQLSARTNPRRTVEPSSGEEVWDVRASLLGILGAVESAMPLLGYVAVNNLAADTHRETTVEIAQNDPAVDAVRQTAIKILEAKGPTATPGVNPAKVLGADEKK